MPNDSAIGSSSKDQSSEALIALPSFRGMIVVLFPRNGFLPLLRPIFDCFLDALKHSQDRPLSNSFRRGRRLHAIHHPHITPPHPHSSVENLDFTLSKPRTITALGAVRAHLDVAHFFWLSCDYCRQALVSGAMPYFCGSADVGFMLELPFGQLKSSSDRRCGAQAKEMSIPEVISKYLQEMGQAEEYKLHGPELKDVTPVTDNMRPPFLRTFHVGDLHVLRSIPKLEEVHVQLFKKEFREVNVPAFPFLIERSGCSLREITLEDCILGVNRLISFLRNRRTLKISHYVSPCGMIGWIPVFWRFDLLCSVNGGEEGEGESLVPRLTELNVVVQFAHGAFNVVPEGHLN